MDQHVTTLTFETAGIGLFDITDHIAGWIDGTAIDTGLLTAFCQHTSASLLITENASPAVHRDMVRWLGRIAPEAADYEHDDEGPDDMPAHLKAMLSGNSLTIPVTGGRMALGTWQGIFVAEHRHRPHRRKVVLHICGA